MRSLSWRLRNDGSGGKRETKRVVLLEPREERV